MAISRKVIRVGTPIADQEIRTLQRPGSSHPQLLTLPCGSFYTTSVPADAAYCTLGQAYDSNENDKHDIQGVVLVQFGSSRARTNQSISNVSNGAPQI
jgi:hypothetical protein